MGQPVGDGTSVDARMNTTFPIPPEQQPGNQPNNPQPQAGEESETLPRSEAVKAFAARDKARAEAKKTQAMLNALAGRLGIDPAELKAVESANGLEVTGDALEDVAKLVSDARGQQPAAEREQQIRAAEAKKYGTKLSKYEAYIEKQAVENNLRNALLSAGATPDGIKQAVQLMRTTVKKEIVFDDETGDMKVVLTGHDEQTGEPLLNGSGDAPADLTHVAERWLRANPIFAKAKFQRGPGAGGMAPAHMGGQPVQPMTPGERGRLAGASIFGPQYALTTEQRRAQGMQAIFGPMTRNGG